LSISELNQEINRRRRALPALQRRREKAMQKVAKLDAMIASLGGSSGGVRAGRNSNSGTLVDYLIKENICLLNMVVKIRRNWI
ncbi:MAG TPA: hypothetical protein PLD02_15485, partial [Saprospiraceae bacterium]|nr:hypothetical protein [Saprospiraceae bacterium]